LALVKQLVEQHGGSVSAASAGPDQGSTFTVRLPLLTKRVSTDRVRESSVRFRTMPPPVKDKLKVLLVEDSEDIRHLMQVMLERAGHSVEAVEDGPRALEVAAAEEFDLALIDIGLPEMGGVEVCRRMRQLVGSRTRLVAATGYGHSEVREEAKAASFDAYLIKPVGVPELERELAMAARNRSDQPLVRSVGQ
jgi:CheY-like chemotaxis protein